MKLGFRGGKGSVKRVTMSGGSETLEAAAIRRMGEFVSAPLFTEEETLNRHRAGLGGCYVEAARVEFGALEEASAEERELMAGISVLEAQERSWSELCREIEGVIGKIGSISALRESAREKASEVKTACDELLASQRESLDEAATLDEALRDLAPLSASELERSLRREDAAGVERLMRELDEREERLLRRDRKFSDELEFVQVIAKTRAEWAGRILETVTRLVSQRASDGDALREVAGTLGTLQRELRRVAPAKADEAQRVYCAARVRAIRAAQPHELDEACKAERRLHAEVFGGDDDAVLDEALHAACDERVHAPGRAKVLSAATLKDLKALVVEAENTKNDEALDDAVRSAGAALCFDAQERAIFVASTALRESVERSKPTTSELERAASSPAALYAPVAAALDILADLHGAVRAPVFDEFAQHAVVLCVDCLRDLPPLPHRDLFAVKHLLALRERVVPYGISYGALVRRKLNWAAARPAQNYAPRAPKARGGILGKWLRAALPTVDESREDARHELESELKARCADFVKHTKRAYVADLDDYLAAVAAALPKDASVLDASPAIVSKLRGLPLAQPAHIGHVLRTALDAATTHAATLDAALALFLDNANTRALLLKPAKHRASQTLADFKATAAVLLAPDVKAELDPAFAAFAKLLDHAAS